MDFIKYDKCPDYVIYSGNPNDPYTAPRWSADFTPPSVGDHITITLNGVGEAKVTGYAVQGGFLGVMAYPLDPPEWWVKQNGYPSADSPSIVFGRECKLIVGRAYKTYEGDHPDIQINVLDELPHDRYVIALERFRDAIKGGRPLAAADDRTPGCKDTSCSWGLCDSDKTMWPDAQDHTFPIDFEKRGRVSTLDTGHCPLDKRGYGNDDFNGCFWTCRVFQRARNEEPVTREQALALYDEVLVKAKEQSHEG